MKRKITVPIAIVVALIVLLSVDIIFRFDVVARVTGLSLTKHQASRIIEEANYCKVSADCVLVAGGPDDGQCGSNVLVNVKEVQHIALSCRTVTQFYKLTDFETDPGDKNPQCREGRCVPGPSGH